MGSVIVDKDERACLATYYRSKERWPVLSQIEENRLNRRRKRGDHKAREKLIQSNLRYVIVIAYQYMYKGIALSDLIQEGNSGLVKGVDRFDETRGVKLVLYAVWWIRQAILQSFADQAHSVRLPTNQAMAYGRMKKARSALTQQFSRTPTYAEIARKTEIKVSDVKMVLEASIAHGSLDAPFSAISDNTLIDALSDDSIQPPDDSVYVSDRRAVIFQALSVLTPRESMVIELYFKLNGEPARNHEEIGARLGGLTPEYVRQVKEKALFKLRYSEFANALRDYHTV